MFLLYSRNLIKPRHLFGEENGNPLQYSCLGNPMDRGAWWPVVHGVTKNRAGLSKKATKKDIKRFKTSKKQSLCSKGALLGEEIDVSMYNCNLHDRCSVSSVQLLSYVQLFATP